MELAAILGPILSYALLKLMLDHSSKERAARLRLLEQALANPQIDRATVNALAQQLTGSGRKWGMAVLLAVGWLTLFSGLGLILMGIIRHMAEASAAGAITALVGFGLVTYPFALSELEARRQPQ